MTSRRCVRMRLLAAGLSMGIVAALASSAAVPAAAAPDFSGFSTFAQATPLRIEIFEPAIPIPSSPQLELNLSYTKVTGGSGPTGTARASALWPGDSIGEGLKTFGEQLGLPGALTDGGYPAQVNAQTPGETSSARQEFLPGSVGRAQATPEFAQAKAGYGTTGDVAEGDDGSGSVKQPNLLEILLAGPTALTNFLLNSLSGRPGEPPVQGSPLGLLGALVSVGGVESVSTTRYNEDRDAVEASASARLGTVALLGGIVKLDGVEVVTKVTSNNAAGAKVSRSVNLGALTLAGIKLGLGSSGVTAPGKSGAIPGLPDDPLKALKALGISIEVGQTDTTRTGPAGSITAEGLRITLDTAPLLSLLPKLPLGDLINGLPDLPGQASILKGLLLGLAEAKPKVSLVLGQTIAKAEVAAPLPAGTPPPAAPAPAPVDTPAPVAGGAVDVPGLSGTPATASGSPAVGPAVVAPPLVTNLVPTSAFPDLGGVPLMLTLAGLALAGALGQLLSRASSTIFGAGGRCTHGLRSGVPDLRSF